jgi:Lon protease-like protein
MSGAPRKPDRGGQVEREPDDREAETSAATATPLFPLPNVQLFPGCIMPLHIFEPRYRQMIEDLLDGQGRMVIGTVPDEFVSALPGSPPIYPVAGLGEIGRHERLPDGRFLIWLVGLSRVRVREVESSRPYRKVSVEMLPEKQVAPTREAELRKALQRAILARCDEFLNLPNEMPLGYLADLLLQKLRLPCERMQELYAETDVERRVCGALREHVRRPVPPPRTPPSGA